VLERHRAQAIVAPVPHVDVNGARLWVEEEGAGPAVLFVHGGLGDSRLWEPQVPLLAQRFRCVRYDLRFWGRSESPGVEYSALDDLFGVLDALGVERAALVGLSLGGGLALDAALARPERVWALVHVAAGVSGMPVDPYTPEQTAAYESAEERGDTDAMLQIDLDVWAPLGADETLRELWRVTPDARGAPEGARALPRGEARLEDVSVPTLVVVPDHDPPALRAVGEEAARRIAGARLARVDSDHYLTLRRPQQVGELLLEFLGTAAPAEG
jgi:pimeloyl-ACP methyl ester carboxylesterase